tara:strand:- start:8694 stop:9455 length:762 start_codon:yes stop_codon:yes gene_type:complete
MAPKITLQLYTLREALAADLPGTLQKIRDIGFSNVEPAGFFNLTVAQYKESLNRYDLKAPSAHLELPVGDRTNEIIETAQELGTKYLVTGIPPNRDEAYNSLDHVKAMAALYQEAAENAAKHGLFVGFHNHDFDLQEVEGTRAYKVFLENTPDTVLWEIDVYWVARAGIDPVEFIREIGNRGRLLHLKDGNAKDMSVGPTFLPCGEGDVDLVAAANAAEHAELAAVELDYYSGDMLEAVEKSYQYLTLKGLAQ